MKKTHKKGSKMNMPHVHSCQKPTWRDLTTVCIMIYILRRLPLW